MTRFAMAIWNMLDPMILCVNFFGVELAWFCCGPFLICDCLEGVSACNQGMAIADINRGYDGN